ncbi:MAG: hypothetical protein J0I81_13825, partial [Hyphomicrobium sp.]|nr:hypothetical protein [Hyphomicrobium sp.]
KAISYTAPERKNLVWAFGSHPRTAFDPLQIFSLFFLASTIKEISSLSLVRQKTSQPFMRRIGVVDAVPKHAHGETGTFERQRPDFAKVLHVCAPCKSRRNRSNEIRR